MMIGMLLFWGLLILGIVLLTRRSDARGQRPDRTETETAAEILDRRLAEGTISEDDYQERRKVLTG